jgi:hypothetical protein
MNGK